MVILLDFYNGISRYPMESVIAEVLGLFYYCDLSIYIF